MSQLTDDQIREAVCRAEGIAWRNRGDRQRRRVDKIVAEIKRELMMQEIADTQEVKVGY